MSIPEIFDLYVEPTLRMQKIEEAVKLSDAPEFVKYGNESLFIILKSFCDFDACLDFIKAMRPMFRYTRHFSLLVDYYHYFANSCDCLGNRKYKSEYLYDGIVKKTWLLGDKFHQVQGPAYQMIERGQTVQEKWYRNGKLYRKNGPSVIIYHGKKCLEYSDEFIKFTNEFYTLKIWKKNGVYHRDDGPAILLTFSGNLEYFEWYKNGSRIIKYNLNFDNGYISTFSEMKNMIRLFLPEIKYI